MRSSRKSRKITSNIISSPSPESATQLGDHRFDDRLTDYSKAKRDEFLAHEKEVLAALQKFDDPSKLTGPNQVDVRILRENVEGDIFGLEELKEADWNPLVYNDSLANSLYLLVARDFDTPEKRIPNLRKRMEANPARDRAGESKPATFATHLHRDRHRTDRKARSTSSAKVSIRCSIARRGKEGNRAIAGENSESSGRLQEMAAK